MSAPTKSDQDKAAVIRQDIERTRADMSRTVDEIEHRLSPAHLKEQVADLKENVLGQFHDAKEQIKSELKGDFVEAKDKIQGEIAEAKGKVRDEIADVKTAAYDATVGRVNHMVHDARETVTVAGTSVLGTIKANPIPAAMIALGIGWLVMGARSRSTTRRIYARPYGGEELDLYAGYVGEGGYAGGVGTEGYGVGVGYDREAGWDEPGWEGDVELRPGVVRRGKRVAAQAARSVSGGAQNVGQRVGEVGRNVGERVGEVGRNVGERVAGAGHRVADGASHLAQNAASTAHRVGERATHIAHDARGRAIRVAGDARDAGRRVVRGAGHQLHRAEATAEVAFTDNPIAFGALAFATGAAIGLALPHTGPEDQLMGEVKEQLFARAQGAAHEALHRVEEKVGEVANVATQAQAAIKSVDNRVTEAGPRTDRIGGLENEVKSSIGKQI